MTSLAPDIVTADPVTKKTSDLPVSATVTLASAFGEDIADDSYSVSELSHYDDHKSPKKGGKGGGKKSEKFGKSKLSGLGRKDSVPADSFPPENGDTTDSKDPKGSSGSADKSDEASSPQSQSGGDSDDSDVTITTFTSFAQARFQTKIPPTYSCSALPGPLLPKADKADFLASMASWVAILRIMGDMPDVDIGDSLTVSGLSPPIVSRVRTGFSTKYTKKDVDEFLKKYSDLFKDPTGTDTRGLPFLTSASDTMLDKIQMVCAIGIFKPSLRDELYCQLCKQLSGNPSRNSAARGWVLMSLMVSSFAPSERFISSLTSFLREGPSEFVDRIDLRLRRTCSAGTRGYPPSWLEFQAAKNGKPLLIPINFMNGHRMLIEMDGATTVGEIVSGICTRLNIPDTTGFSVYIGLQSRISCLGNGTQRSLDAVAECEQHSKMMGIKEANSAWRIFMRQEFFAPWQLSNMNAAQTDLVYQQIYKGVSMGEYQFDKEERLLKVASMIYMIEHPDDENFDQLQPFLSEFIPENILERRAESYFEQNVRSIVENNKAAKKGEEYSLAMKVEIVRSAREEFHMNFSRFYDATRVAGPGFTLPDMMVGINHKGLFLIDSRDKLRMELNFCEIIDVSVSKNHIIMTMVGQGELIITMQYVDDFYDLLRGFLKGLRETSTYALARQDVTQLDGASDTNIVKGDLLELSQPLGKDYTGETIRVLCKRTSMSADVPVSLLYVLTTTEPPNKDVLNKLVTQLRKDVSPMLPPTHKADTTTSLEQFAKTKFRTDSHKGMSKFFSKASFKGKNKQDSLWQYSKDELKKPLLKKTCKRDDVRKLACHTFTSIQTYMANLVINDDVAHYNLCLQWVIDPARRNKYIRDEVFCQIIKQLTKNPDKANEDRGWVLLCLLSSITQPTPSLMDHVRSFLLTSTHPLAQRCAHNLHLQARQGAYRLYSSHFLEHSMVCKGEHCLKFQVFLPNQTAQSIEVTSQTRVHEIKKQVAERLKLKSFAEYSLFLTSNEKVYCLLDRAFFFDSLSHSEHYWFRSPKRQSAKVTSTPMLVMLKKIWIHAAPGEDTAADSVFHFPQEIPNYLRGYHHIPEPKQVVRMAAYVYRSLFGEDSANFNKFGEISSQLFPQNFLSGKNEKEFEEMVKTSFLSHKGMNQLEAKIKFLDEVETLSTYGCVFFEVKQRQVTSLPTFCLIAVNFNGVFIINRDTKVIIKTYDFSNIPNWAYDDVSFTFIFSEGKSTRKLLVETKVGHNIDELLMSYIAWIMNFHMRKKMGYVGGYAGESIC